MLRRLRSRAASLGARSPSPPRASRLRGRVVASALLGCWLASPSRPRRVLASSPELWLERLAASRVASQRAGFDTSLRPVMGQCPGSARVPPAGAASGAKMADSVERRRVGGLGGLGVWPAGRLSGGGRRGVGFLAGGGPTPPPLLVAVHPW